MTTRSFKRAIARGKLRYRIIQINNRPSFIDLERRSARGRGAKTEWIFVQRFTFDPQKL